MHGSYKTEAVVLRSLRLGEADRVLHLYTPARGRVGAVAKGVRRTRSRVGARLEPFSHVALVLHEGRGELHTVSGVDTLATHHAVREQPERARIAGACGEALLRMFAEGDPSPRVFAALCRLLDVLEDYAPAAGDIALDPLLLAFQLKLHGLAGFAPRLSACASCSAEGVPLVRFSAAAGGAVCGSCPGGLALPAAALDALAALLRAPLAELPALTPQTAAVVARCASDLNAEHGGFRLRSLALTAGGVSRFGQLVLVAAVATLGTVLVRALAGEALGSDAYSHLVWARDAVRHGVTSHAPFDYTVPKPFEQGVAALGTKLGAATFVFEWVSLAGAFACAAAAAALARRLGPPPAAQLAALFAFCLPVLWRGGPLGDSNVPYAALVVAAAASGIGTPWCAALLTVAGTLRPEAWGLALVNAVLGWREATLVGRILSIVASIVPPALWLTLDHVFTGDWWWSSNIVDAYNDRFHPPLLHLTDLPGAVISRVGDVSTWPVALLGLAALAVGLKQRPYDAGVVFPVALVVAVVLIVIRGQISADDVGRMLTALAVFAAAGAAVALAEHNAGMLRGSFAVIAVAAVPLAAAPWLAGAVHDVRDQSRQARALENTVGPALERAAPAGYIALPRQWQGQLALSWDRPRSSFIPARAINTEVDQCQVAALVVRSDGRLPRWIRQVAVTHDWRAGVRARPCTH